MGDTVVRFNSIKLDYIFLRNYSMMETLIYVKTLLNNLRKITTNSMAT